MDHLQLIADALKELIPPEISELTAKLETELKGRQFSKAKAKQNKILTYLKTFRTLNVFGFNSCEYFYIITTKRIEVGSI